MIPIMTTHMRSLLIIPALALLSACNPEEKDGPKQEATDITSENTVLSFSSEAQGDYPVVTNLSLNNPVSAHPIVATIPELFKLEQADELEQYLQSSEALGFDREAFDNITAVTWEVIEAVRYRFVNDILGGLGGADGEIIDKHAPSQKLEINSTLDRGSRGKGRRFTYSIDQNYITSQCLEHNTNCSYEISLELSFYFPNSNVGVAPNTGRLSLLWGPPMVIEMHELHISQEDLKLSISPKGDNEISVSFGSELVEEGFAPTVKTESRPSIATSKLTGRGLNEEYLQPNRLAIPFDGDQPIASIENWSVQDSPNTFGSKGLNGTFTNSIVDENGDEKTITITGHILANFPKYVYERNFTVENYKHPRFTEEDNVAPLDRNTMTGYLWGVDVEVQFATDINE